MNDVFNLDNETVRIEDDFVRFFLLCGTKRAVMIDSGVNQKDARKRCEGITELPITLINTHGDLDHVSGTGGFEEIHIGREDFENCKLAERFPNVRMRPLADGEIIHLGDRNLKAISIPGHTKGSFAFLDIEKRMLFAGDTVQDGNIFMFGPQRDREKLAASLKKLADMQSEYDSVIASHGTPVLPKDYVTKVLDSWNKVLHGEVKSIPMEMHGTPVQLYKTEFCGFFL